MAAKSPLKTAGLAGLENLVQSMMPDMMKKLVELEQNFSLMRHDIASMHEKFAGIDQKFAALDKKLDTRANELERMIDNRVHELEIKMYDRFESTRDVINEVGSQVNGVDKKLEAYVSITRDTAGAYKDLLERVVRVEMIQNPKRKRAI